MDILNNLTPAEREQTIRADYQTTIDDIFFLCRRISDEYLHFERLRRLISDIDEHGAENVFHKQENTDKIKESANKTTTFYDF